MHQESLTTCSKSGCSCRATLQNKSVSDCAPFCRCTTYFCRLLGLLGWYGDSSQTQWLAPADLDANRGARAQLSAILAPAERPFPAQITSNVDFLKVKYLLLTIFQNTFSLYFFNLSVPPKHSHSLRLAGQPARRSLSCVYIGAGWRGDRLVRPLITGPSVQAGPSAKLVATALHSLRRPRASDARAVPTLPEPVEKS